MKLDVLAVKENQKVQNLIIRGIRDLINFKNLEPGDKLPSERMLSEKFEVSRSNLREAIQKLETLTSKVNLLKPTYSGNV